MSDPFYRAFEDKYRGSRASVKQGQMVYLRFLQPLHDVYPGGEVLDLGCGRGEWLELAQAEGFRPLGVDQDSGMLQACKDLHLSTQQGDAIALLAGMQDQSQVAVTAFHLVEHLPFDALRCLVREAWRVLKPGGLLILETPNPENVVVGSRNFYIDPTHERPVPHELLSFLASFHGFARSKILRLHESPAIHDKKFTSIMDVLASVSPDYALIAQKPGPVDVLQRTDPAFAQDFGLSLTTLCGRYDMAQLRLQAQVQRIDGLESQIQHALATGQYALERAHHLQMSMDQLHHSRSWRITAPMRWLSLQVQLLQTHGLGGRGRALLRKLSGSPPHSTHPALPEATPGEALAGTGNDELSPQAQKIHAALLKAQPHGSESD